MCYHSLWQERIFCDKYNVYFSILFKWCSTRQCICARNCMYTAILRKVVGKSARDNHERYCGWFWVRCSSKKFERMAREAMDVCLRVLKESNKSRFDSYSVRNSVLIISHITFRDCRVHIFGDNLSRNSCIRAVPRSVWWPTYQWTFPSKLLYGNQNEGQQRRRRGREGRWHSSPLIN